jgi:hypothetical protein
MAAKNKPKIAAPKRRKTKVIVQDKEELYYMGISNPIEVRRTILECARDMVHFLQLFEKFRIIREEKKEAIKILKKQIKDINGLTNQLKTALPKVSVRAAETKKEKLEIKHEPLDQKETAEAPRKEMPDLTVDDIEALEKELREIEEKLNFL